MSQISLLDKFITAVQEKTGDRIKAIYVLGSVNGLTNPTASDIDLLVIAKDTADKKQLFGEFRALEKHFFATTHSAGTDFLQRHFLASDDFSGLHMIMLFESQVKNKKIPINPLVDLLMSKSLFLYNLEHEGKLLVGNPTKFGHPISVGFKERWLAFFPAILLFLLLFIPRPRNSKIVWIAKLTRYHYQLIRDYYRVQENNSQLSLTYFKIPQNALDLITTLRYNPTQYQGNILVLHFKALWWILQDWKFLFMADFRK